MIKYKTQSANVLNDADRFENVLNFRQFCNDQELMLWTGKHGWRPGDYLYLHPTQRPLILETYADGFQEYVSPGECVRYMVDCFSIDPSNTYEVPYIGRYQRYRCVDCLVDWTGEEPCWMCGADYPLPEMKRVEYKTSSMSHGVLVHGWSPSLRHEPDNDITESNRAAYYQEARRIMIRRMFDELRISRELVPDVSYYDMDVEMDSFRIMALNAWPISYTYGLAPPECPSAFVRTDPIDIYPALSEQFYDPSEEPPYRIPIVITQSIQNLDLSERPTIEPPAIERRNLPLERYLERERNANPNRTRRQDGRDRTPRGN